MPNIIWEKCQDAKRHARNLFMQEPGTGNPLGLEHDWMIVTGCLDTAIERAECLVPKIRALSEIQRCIEERGQHAFTVRKIQTILERAEKEKYSFD